MRPALLAPSLLAGILLAAGAAAADWRQFRGDEFRSGRSYDRVPGPLTDVWSWEPGPFKASRPFGSVAVLKDRLFAFSMENQAPYVVCMDARTGARLWQQALGPGAVPARPDVGPAVTEDGLVYAYGGAFSNARDARAYRGLDGRLVAAVQLPSGGIPAEAELVLRRIFLLHGTRATALIPPGPRAHFRLKGPFSMGPPLLAGGGLTAVSWKDLVMQWSAGSVPEYTRVAHFSPGYQHMDLTPPPYFEGFPSAVVPGGVVVADDAARRFIGVLYPGRSMGWHWDIPWSVGVPSTEGNRLFFGIGGQGARAGLMALGAGTGERLWMFPRIAPPADMQAVSNIFEQYRMSHVASGTPIHPYSMLGAGYDVVPEELPHRTARQPVLPGFEPSGRDVRVEPHGRRGRGRGGPAGRAGEPAPVSPVASVDGMQQVMQCPTPGHFYNIGLVLANRRVHGWIANSLVSLDQATGEPAWIREHPQFHPVTDLVATQDELIVCQGQGTLPTAPPALWGMDLQTGRLTWTTPLPHAGRLAVAHGMVFVNSGEMVTAFAPAERTFRMAIDSPEKSHYRSAAGEPGEPVPSPECGVPEEQPAPAPPKILPPLISEKQPARPLSGLADATTLRLRFGQPLERLVQAARERRRVSGDAPRVLVLDWLTPDRRARIGGQGGHWDAATVRSFADTCARVAAEFQPEHFEIAADVNVFLAYHPTQVEEVRSLLRAASAAIKKAAPGARTVASYNVEVLNGTYGRARYFPFGDVPVQPDAAVQRQLSLLAEVDEVGLTTYPQSGNIGAEQVQPGYLLQSAARLGSRPLLVTRIGVRADQAGPTGLVNQAKFLKRVNRALYWLNAQVVAYPDVVGGKEAETALQAGEEARPALELWRDMLGWKRVESLTAAQYGARR